MSIENTKIVTKEYISPDVYTSESSSISTDYLPSKNVALYVGEFEKGEINKPYWITDILEFKLIFGRALEWNYNHWYQVYNFLQYTSGIWVCRTAGINTTVATNSGNIVNSPGEWGNLMTLEIYNISDYLSSKYLKQIFEYKDLQKEYILIIKRADKIVETFNVNYKSEIESAYFSNIELIPGIYQMQDGYTEEATYIQYQETLEIFSKENYEIDIVISPEDYNDLIIDFVETRKDCVAFLGLPRKFVDVIRVNDATLTTENGLIIILSMKELYIKLSETDYNLIVDYIETLQKSTYAFFCIGFKIIEDGFSGSKKMINAIADIAALKVKASDKDMWTLGCGIERGTIKNFESLALRINEINSEDLYKKGVNCLKGETILSQKLFIDSPSVVDRLHSRFIMNALERSAEKLLRKYIFGINERTYRGIISTSLKKVLEDMLMQGAFENAKVIVRKGKNENEIYINIYIKIPYLTENITINMTNAGTKLFSEIQIT